MKREIRISALAVGVMFALLAGNLTYIQAIDPDKLADNPLNPRGRLERYSIKRGAILAGYGAGQIEIARSVPNEGKLKYRREYPNGPLYASVTGYQSPNMGSGGLESRFDSTLQGADPGSFWRNVNDWLSGDDRRGDNIITTIEPALQQVAFDALGNQKGAVIALNPRNGDVLAMVSKPTWDPNALASVDSKAVQAAWTALNDDPNNPRLNRATSELYPPGSTFKVVTAAEFLEKGGSMNDTFKDPPSIALPGSSARIGNSGRSTCAGGGQISLRQALVVSCNTTFADIGINDGPVALITQAEKFGFNREIPFDTQIAMPTIPKNLDQAQAAQSAIGQYEVRSSPLHMAMIAGAIANDGVMMTPRLVRSITDQAGRVLVAPQDGQPISDKETPNGRVVSPASAKALNEAMQAVVDNGTGRRARINGVRVAGKTGTAQRGQNLPPHAWFIGFAPADNPTIAVAAIVEGGGDAGDDATGGSVAAPIVKEVMETALGK